MFGKEWFPAKAIEAGARLYVRSALNPVLWLCAIITCPGLLAIILSSNPPMWLIILTCAPVATAIFGFMFLLFFDRDKLQSEDYQLKKRSLELIEEKGDPGPILISADEVEAIPEPETNQLSEEGE